MADLGPDASVPNGTPVDAVLARPVDRREPPACSARAPVCVHRGTSDPVSALETLDALELAYRRLVFAMELPAPLSDWGKGGSDALDLYLDPSATEPLRTDHDDGPGGAFDSVPAFCLAAPAHGALLARAAVQCVSEAIAWRLDAAESPSTRRAFATSLWWEIGSPTSLDVEAVARVQAEPERALIEQTESTRSEGDALAFEFLDERRGTESPGALPTALLSASAQATPAGALLWRNEPDVFDVLRHTFGPGLGGLAKLWRDLAVSRAALPGDEPPLPALLWSKGFATPRVDWTLAASSLPRNVACAHEVAPTGSVYVRLDLDRWDDKSTLGLRASWEPHAAFAWTVVRIDGAGRDIGHLDVPFAEGESSAEARVVRIDGARALLFVGTNVGGLGKADTFDPDVVPVEPSGCELYFARL